MAEEPTQKLSSHIDIKLRQRIFLFERAWHIPDYLEIDVELLEQHCGHCIGENYGRWRSIAIKNCWGDIVTGLNIACDVKLLG